LGVLLRKVWGLGKPRSGAAFGGGLFVRLAGWWTWIRLWVKQQIVMAQSWSPIYFSESSVMLPVKMGVF
jgi:hypothetical protein